MCIPCQPVLGGPAAVTNQVHQVQLESIGHPAQDREGWICNSPLQLACVGPVDTGKVSQFFLRNAHGLALHLDGAGDVLSNASGC